MKIAVLSGKGGTGKTFVSVNLACSADTAVYADCDVEEPNGRLFLRPVETREEPVPVMIPEVEGERCTGCKSCVRFCRFNALAHVRGRLILFPEICHSCGGCVLFCPEKALRESTREIGMVEEGRSGNVTVLTGCLNVGEASGVPVIKRLMEKLPEQGLSVIDCPPGSACTAMESIRQADFCLLVAEPTRFGAHNLAMVYELVRVFHKPFGVVLNKCLPGENPTADFCEENHIPILARISYTQELAELNSRGGIAVREKGSFREMFRELLKKAEEGARP
jgi:MinD superfamily P-loop ATPase